MFVKREIRVIGVDDAPFDKFRDKKTEVIGTFFRGGNFMDGLLSTTVEVDGEDATGRIAGMINKSKFRHQTQAILLDGIAVAGFNVINIKKLYEETGIAVIVFMRRMPDINGIKESLAKLGMHDKIKMIEDAGGVNHKGEFWFQISGTDEDTALEILKTCTVHGNIPEPLRVAHIIASGVKLGESHGKA